MNDNYIMAFKYGLLDNGYICVGVLPNDCPDTKNNKQVYVDSRNGQNEVTCHCYDTHKILRPLTNSEEYACPNFIKCLDGKVYCKLIK